MKPHKHAELIKAWADGAKIEKNNGLGHWIETNHPDWMSWEIYRIKPEPKPDFYRYFVYHNDRPCIYPHSREYPANLKLYFDGETGELKEAEVLK
jgi:hypothetical protein